ncbi:MAG TPA: hypothetical protein VG994_14860 [Steroidobacteraceae bacterium]|nr:hypothetical protein [Steroidobacteraceae bacterium]
MTFTRAAALLAAGLAIPLAQNVARSADALAAPKPGAQERAAPHSTTPTAKSAAKARGCLPSGNGFLRARIRGALNLDINWHNAELECEGTARPNGHGIRLSFAGPVQSDGRRLRMVFGVADAAEGGSGSALPTNLTVIFEGEKRLFATRGDDRCTVDKLDQERFGALGGPTRSYRVVARGFCIEPVAGLAANERIVVSSFDFAGQVTFVTPTTSTPEKAEAH